MEKNKSLATATSTASTLIPEAATLPPEYTPQGVTTIIDEEELLRRIPVCRRTLADWKRKGLVPFIRMGRRVLYDWPTFHRALLRQQRGGCTQ
jgi:hypothetical protein